MKRMTLAIGLLLLAALATADSWYSIDGFSVRTAPGVRIDADNGSTEIIGFSVTGADEPEIAGWLVDAGGSPISDKDMIVVGTISIVRALMITVPAAIGSSCRARPRATSAER